MEPRHLLLADEIGRRELLLGNEAIVRGAIEAGVGLVTGYPGTPATEIGDTFRLLHAQIGVLFDDSVNEKIALETAFGACLTGVRALVSMKHLGLCYGADPLSTMPYIGVVGGLVIVSAADPGCLTSPNEQDQRYLAKMLGIPTLDPSTPDEARRMTAFAFQLSEGCELPVLLRVTTRLCHTRAAVEFGALAPARPAPRFRRDPERFVPTPHHARRMRELLDHRLARARELLEASPFNPATHPAAPSLRGVVAAGVPRNAVRDVLRETGAGASLLEIGALHPLPERIIVPFLSSFTDVLVVEELTPYLEDSLLALAHRHGLAVRIHGKHDGRMQGPFELSRDEIDARVREFLGLENPAVAGVEPAGLEAPLRPPVLCAGCPHRNTFHAVTAVFGDEVVYVNDIGCYTLGGDSPHDAGDVLLAMGSSIPIAAGIARTTGERVVAFIGDSTFFHSGMPALLNAVQRDDNIVLVVMDNHVTAMTGLQPSPTSLPGDGGDSRERRRIGDLVRAMGANDVTEVSTADVAALIRTLQRAKEQTHLSVVIAEGPCALLTHPAPGSSAAVRPAVNSSRCHTCGMDDAGLHCGLEPSIEVQRRVAAQRALHGATGGPVPAVSPCSAECPLGICIPAYVGAIAAGEPERALLAVTLRAALPSVCAYICHRPCEPVCVRAGTDLPIAVNDLKRFLTDHHLGVAAAPCPPADGLPVAVVGAGPAGLAAARELARRGYAPTLLDARERPGGMLEYAIPDYRLPRSVLRRDIEGILALPIQFEGGVRLGRDFSLEDLRRRGFAAILIALGAQRGTRPSIPGAGLDGASDALAFLAERPSLAGDRVVVLGGGDVAVDAARLALRLGAAAVTLAFPEPEAEMAAAPDSVDFARREGVQFRGSNAALAVRAGAVELARVVGFARGHDGDVRWERTEGGEELPATRVIFATGQRPVFDGIDLPADFVLPSGLLAADAFGRTAGRDLFAAGDCVTGPSTVTEAMAAGVRAAWAIDVRLSGDGVVEGPAAPLPRPHRTALRRFVPRPAAATGGFDANEARAEAQRCLLCGMCMICNTCVDLLGCPAILRDGPGAQPHIVETLCTACGLCVVACPNDAIEAFP